MQTITIQIPDDKLSYILSKLDKIKDIKIEYNTEITDNNDIKDSITQAVKEVNLIKQGKSKARLAKEFLNEL